MRWICIFSSTLVCNKLQFSVSFSGNKQRWGGLGFRAPPFWWLFLWYFHGCIWGTLQWMSMGKQAETRCWKWENVIYMKGVGWWMRHIQCIILHRALTFEKNSTARSMDAQISSTSSIDGSPGTVTCLGKHLSFPCSSLSIFFFLFLFTFSLYWLIDFLSFSIRWAGDVHRKNKMQTLFQRCFEK